MTSAPPNDAERLYGLLLFDAEESLARGEAEKAMVLASRAVKERPDNFTARALVERARQELTRGKRRERLEARIGQAASHYEAGEFAAAEKIVTSALKLVPDHDGAHALFAKLRDRPRAGAIEAEADRELARLARHQAQKALEGARAARDAGWDRRALVHLLRGLRQVPDHAELLAMLREIQGAAEGKDGERARRRALHAQVRAGLELLAEGRRAESLRILRVVLLEDPDNVRAQAAIQEVRRSVLAGSQPSRAAAGVSDAPDAAPARAAPAVVLPAHGAAAAAAPARAGSPADLVADRSLPFVPVEILLPRTRRHRTPARWIVTGAALVAAVMILLSFSGRGGPARAPAAPAGTAPATPPQETRRAAPGPLDGIHPELRAAVEATLTAYAQALERGDARALAAARPDLAASAREERLRPFLGAVNAATAIRVLDAIVTGERAEVPILSTDVIVGGNAGPPGSALAETLVFERRQGAWALASLGRVLVRLEEVGKVYARGQSDVHALDGLSLAIEAGESVAIMGPSGSGKSTLLAILGCLDRPSSGRYVLDGTAVESLSDEALSRVRNQRIGFVFQSFHLIPQLTVVENVETPLFYRGLSEAECRSRALACLERVGLLPRAGHRPSELSGGEAQRAAVARALVTEPRILLADEPTGNLDTKTGEDVIGLLEELNRDGNTVVLVTHNESLGRRARRVVRLRDGRVEREERG